MPDEKKRTRRKAVAVTYDTENEGAPKVVAKGSGYLADRIIELAREHNVHIHHDPDLAAVLAKVDVNTEIPPELYRTVAEILAFVYRINGKLSEFSRK